MGRLATDQVQYPRMRVYPRVRVESGSNSEHATGMGTDNGPVLRVRVR